MFEGLFQPMHLLVILGIAVLVFGPKKLPELGKGLGEGIRGFKAAMREEEKPVEARSAAGGKTRSSQSAAGPSGERDQCPTPGRDSGSTPVIEG